MNLMNEITCPDRVLTTKKEFWLPGLGLAIYYACLSGAVAWRFSSTGLLANISVKFSKIKLGWFG